MAGQMSFGKIYNNAGAGNFREGRAFAEGIQFRASGTLVGAPKSANPLPTGSEAAEAWDAGWDFAEAGKSGSVPLDTSALSVAPVGLVAL